MSQDQPRRPRPEPIKYGDVLPVSGELAEKAVTMKDAAAMQSAETRVLGETLKGGAAAIMHSAALLNEQRRVVKHDEMTDLVRDRGVSVKEDVGADGTPIVTEEVGGEVVAQFVHPGKEKSSRPIEFPPEAQEITIGQALEAVAVTAGDKPVDESDAAAIQAAEVRATGLEHVIAGGVAAQARSAAAQNAKTLSDERKIKLADILKDSKKKLLDYDKIVTKQDAERVMGAELRNKESVSTYPGGVGEAIVEAAKFNQNKSQNNNMAQ